MPHFLSKVELYQPAGSMGRQCRKEFELSCVDAQSSLMLVTLVSLREEVINPKVD